MTFFYGSPFPKITDWEEMSVDYEAEAKGNRVCQLLFKSYGARQLQTGWVEATGGGGVGVR